MGVTVTLPASDAVPATLMRSDWPPFAAFDLVGGAGQLGIVAGEGERADRMPRRDGARDVGAAQRAVAVQQRALRRG